MSRYEQLMAAGGPQMLVVFVTHTVCPKKVSPLTFCNNNRKSAPIKTKILHTQDDICYKHYYVVSYKSALTLLKYEFLNNITHKS